MSNARQNTFLRGDIEDMIAGAEQMSQQQREAMQAMASSVNDREMQKLAAAYSKGGSDFASALKRLFGMG